MPPEDVIKEVPLPLPLPAVLEIQPPEDQIRELAFRLWEAETGGMITSQQTAEEIWLESESLLKAGWAEGKAI